MLAEESVEYGVPLLDAEMDLVDHLVGEEDLLVLGLCLLEGGKEGDADVEVEAD